MMKRQATDRDKDSKKTESLLALLTEITVTPEESDKLFKKMNIYLSYDPETMLLGIYFKETKCVHTRTYI